MIPMQPTMNLQYFRKKPVNLPENVRAKLYLSWEDALWDVLRSFSIPKKSNILVPSFFCVDVMNNMKDHGLDPHYYEVNEYLQPNNNELLKKINQLKPSIVVLFHAVGITNTCVNKQFIRQIPSNIFILEDCVHKVTDPSEIQLFSDRHILINSFRKVVPLQGSFLFAKSQIIQQLQGAHNTFLYSSSVILLWFLMQVCFLGQKYIHNTFGIVAEWCMLKGYDIIGDEKNAGNCPQFFADSYMHLNFKEIKRIKKLQVKRYKSELIKHASWYVPHHSAEDEYELRGYPIVLKKQLGEKVISFLRSNGLYIRAELDDSLWTKKRSIIYLPLGLHLEKVDTRCISSLFNSAISWAHNTSINHSKE